MLQRALSVYFPSAAISLACRRLGFLSFPLLVDEYLRSEILKHRLTGVELGRFQVLVRNSRLEISFLEEKSVFFLNKKNIGLD